MNVYSTDKIRNVVLLGHGGCGKTSLAEAMAFLSGQISRMGKVPDGNTISDFDKEEVKRQFSISTSVIPIEWQGCKINVLDTPGFFDFAGEVQEAASAADAAIIVVSGKSDIEVGTRKSWELCERLGLPRMFFITDMDVENANYNKVVKELQEIFGKKVAPFHMPLYDNDKFFGYGNVITRRCKKWLPDGNVELIDMPAGVEDEMAECREVLMESIAETSEEYMDRFFGGEEFTEVEILNALYANVSDGTIVPVLMGSNVQARGMFTLMVDIIKYLPSPAGRKVAGTCLKKNEPFEAEISDDGPKSAYIYKTIVDPFIGKYSLIKVISGVLKPDDLMYCSASEKEMKIGKLYVMRGAKAEEVAELHAGDLGALQKVEVNTLETLSTKADPCEFEKAKISKPYTYMKYDAKTKGEEDKISQALTKLCQEDLTLKVVNDGENSQSLIYGIGEQQLEVVASKLATKYKVEIELSKPRIAFKETIRKKSDVEYKYKKQSGGHGQYGHVKMTFEPSGDLENPYVFEQTVVGGSVPKNFFPAVEKGIQDSVLKGPMAAYPVVGVKAVLYDGSYHPVDSSEMAFKVAASQAFKKGFMDANPVLLEPIASLRVLVPDVFTGDIMGDLNKRRGRVLGMNPVEGGKQEILADVPYSELYGYTTNMRAITGGAGEYSYEFARYEQAPSDVQEKEVAARASALDNSEE
ncbi:MAG: elongation factor G [Lachnospiraceae bacterium]|nr:elongation factor G [Lachnospiraceae bacterium]